MMERTIEGIFEVEKLIACRTRTRGGLQFKEYRVRWKGFGPKDDTWEPKKHLSECLQFIDIFKAETLEKRRRSSSAKRKALVKPKPLAPEVKMEFGDDAEDEENSKRQEEERRKKEQKDIRGIEEEMRDSVQRSFLWMQTKLREHPASRPVFAAAGVTFPLPIIDLPPAVFQQAFPEPKNVRYWDGIFSKGAQNVWHPWWRRIEMAALLGDLDLVKKFWTEWQHTSDDASQAQELAESTMDRRCGVTLLMRLSWERAGIRCSSRRHCWCAIIRFLAPLLPASYINAATNREKWTALMVAAHQGALCQVEALLEAGSLVSSTDRIGRTALDLATERDEKEMSRLLILHGAQLPPSITPPPTPLPPLFTWESAGDWVANRQQGIDGLMREWVESSCVQGLLEAANPICPTVNFSLQDQSEDLSFCAELFRDDVFLGCRAILFLFPVVYTELEKEQSANQPSLRPLLNSEENRRLGLPQLDSVRVNGKPQAVLNAVQNSTEGRMVVWVTTAMGVRVGLNRVELRMSGCGPHSSAVQLFVQPWLCRAATN